MSSDSGWSSRSTPLPMKVSATGMFNRSANRVRAAAAFCRTTPLPARMIGALASEMSLAARSTCAAGGSGRWGDCTSSGSPATSASAMSLGKVDVGGARLLGFRHLERLAHDLRDNRGGLDLGVPLGDRVKDIHHVDVLVRLLVHTVERRLPGDRHQRGAVHVGVGPHR